MWKTPSRTHSTNGVAGRAPTPPRTCAAKVRYRQTDQPCRIEAFESDAARVHFDTPQRAVTPGQSVVFYDGDICLGGGVIDRRLKANGVSDKIAA